MRIERLPAHGAGQPVFRLETASLRRLEQRSAIALAALRGQRLKRLLDLFRIDSEFAQDANRDLEAAMAPGARLRRVSGTKAIVQPLKELLSSQLLKDLRSLAGRRCTLGSSTCRGFPSKGSQGRQETSSVRSFSPRPATGPAWHTGLPRQLGDLFS